MVRRSRSGGKVLRDAAHGCGRMISRYKHPIQQRFSVQDDGRELDAHMQWGAIGQRQRQGEGWARAGRWVVGTSDTARRLR